MYKEYDETNYNSKLFEINDNAHMKIRELQLSNLKVNKQKSMTIDLDKEIRPMSRGGRSSCGNRMNDTKTSFDNNIKSFNNTAKSDLFLNFNNNLNNEVNIMTFDDNNDEVPNDNNDNQKMSRTMSISEMRKLQMSNNNSTYTNEKGDDWEINDNKKIKSSKSVNINKEKENMNKLKLPPKFKQIEPLQQNIESVNTKKGLPPLKNKSLKQEQNKININLNNTFKGSENAFEMSFNNDDLNKINTNQDLDSLDIFQYN